MPEPSCRPLRDKATQDPNEDEDSGEESSGRVNEAHSTTTPTEAADQSKSAQAGPAAQSTEASGSIRLPTAPAPSDSDQTLNVQPRQHPPKAATSSGHGQLPNEQP
jgi:hypothetical protein